MTEENKVVASAPRLQFIDGLRGIAVLMVVIFHSAVWGGLPVEGIGNFYLFEGRFPIELGRLRHILSVGGGGVDLFLAISGFCLFWPLVKSGKSVQTLDVVNYLKRRTKRICPPYYFALIVLFVVSYLTYLYQGRSWWPWYPSSFQNAFPLANDWYLNVASHLLLIHGFFNAYINSYEGAYWSLALEWQFYFLFIPLAFVARRAGVLWAVAIPIFVTIAFKYFCAWFYPNFLPSAVGTCFSLNRWAEFGAGMLAAVVVSGSIPSRITAAFEPLKRLGLFYLLISVVVAIRMEYIHDYPHWLPFSWGNASFALITVGAQYGSVMRKLMEWRPLVGLGNISYSLYLTHGIVYMAMAMVLTNTSVSRDVRHTIYLVLGPIFAIVFSTLFFRLFEKPFLSGVKIKRDSEGHLVTKPASTVQDQAIP